MIIDGHSLAFRAFYALPVASFQTRDGQHTNAIHGFLSMLLLLLRNENPTHIAVAFDISRYSFRTREYPEYKGTRGETPSEFIGQIPLLQEALAAMNITTITKEDYEADDILATMSVRGVAEGYDVLVVSGDRDSIQLVNENVTLLYPSSQGVSALTRYDPARVRERYGIDPAQYPDVAALVGETSDNLGLTAFGAIDNPFGLRGSLEIFGIPFGLILGVLVVIMAAYSLVLDFDYIQRGVQNRAPRKYGWTGAFGIMVTVIWLYLEILRMFAIARD